MNRNARTRVVKNYQANRTYQLKTTTQAIRAALASSAFFVAILVGSGAASAAAPAAAPCDKHANALVCDIKKSASTKTAFEPVEDPSLVTGFSIPDSVVRQVDPSLNGMAAFPISVGSVADITEINPGATHAAAGDILTAAGRIVTSSGDLTVVNEATLSTFTVGNGTIFGPNPKAATALSVISSGGDVSVTNAASGVLIAETNGRFAPAIGLLANAPQGSVVVDNSGVIAVRAGGPTEITFGTSPATGIQVNQGYVGNNATVTNSGQITVDAQGFNPYGTVRARAAGIAAYALNEGGIVHVSNEATGEINVTGGAFAFGVIAATGGNYFDTGATSYVDNAGSITATTIGMGDVFGGTDPSGIFLPSLAIGVFASHVTNSGMITATGGGDLADASGITARSDTVGASISINNSGVVYANAGDNFETFARAIHVQGIRSGETTILNSGEILARGTTTFGIVFDGTYGGDLTLENSGSIRTSHDDDLQFWATTAIRAVSLAELGAAGSQLSITNSGDITLDCGLRCWGMNVVSVGNDVAIENSGSIRLTGNYEEHGVYVLELGGAVSFTNSGDISIASDAFFAGASAVEILNFDNTRYGVDQSLPDRTTTIVNSGSIDAFAQALPYGYYLPLRGVSVQALFAYSTNGDINVLNSGEISAESYSYSSQAGRATGIEIFAVQGDINVNTSGAVSALVETNSAYGGGLGVGVFLQASYGDIHLDNSGSIDAAAITVYASDNGRTSAIGAYLTGYTGDVAFSNSESGSISADASTVLFNTVLALGVGVNTLSGDVDVGNFGQIAANAHSTATSYLASLYATTAAGLSVTNLFGDTNTITNGGSISASASTLEYGAADAVGVGIYAGSENSSVVLVNTGSIEAHAVANEHFDSYANATAIGLQAINRYGGPSSITSSGTIDADASGHFTATALGIEFDGTALDLILSGATSASAHADGSVGTAYANGVSATGSALGFELGTGGLLSASASGFDGSSIGLLLVGNSVSARNAGTIRSTFSGGSDGSSYGAIIVANGDLLFTNAGSITAAGVDRAVAVQLSSDLSTTLVNSGTITATSLPSGAIAVLTGDANATIRNSGTVVGAVVTGNGSDVINNTGTLNGSILTAGGDDALFNAGILQGEVLTGDGRDTLQNVSGGLWRALGSSDFGSGDDTITNAGTIVLGNSSISLGSFEVAGNKFINSGRVAVAGTSTIALGVGPLNLFTNTGIVDFRDGFADDVLSITGDFAGSGRLGVDVSGLRGLGDSLHILGNVAANSVTSVDVNLLDLPTTALSSIRVVDVTGNSSASSFVLGNLHFDTARSFLTVSAISLNSSIDTTNARPDTFSVDIAVTGLTESGSLAAAFAPGVQSLMRSQVGTWRERMGVIDHQKKGTPSLWVRLFRDSGTVNPGHLAGNFGQGGSFSFDQRTVGQEIGFDFGLSEQFSAGVLVGKSHATQELKDSNSASTKLDGDTVGLYGTWISPGGLYVDASYRKMNFDARLATSIGESKTEGEASAFNVEAGYAFSLAGNLRIEPQFQYTRTSVNKTEALTGVLTGFNSDGGTSSRGRVGVAVRSSFGKDGVSWTPYAAVSAVREFDGENTYDIDGNFFGNTSIEGTSALVEGGLTVRTGKLVAFGGLSWQHGGALESVVGGQLGVRYNW